MTNPKRIKYCIEFQPLEYHQLKVESLEAGWPTLSQYLHAIIKTRKCRNAQLNKESAVSHS